MISAIVLTHNDERILARCLESLKWCDELLVIDDESTDGTVGIAKNHGAKVFTRKLDGDFAAQRNFGLSKAKGDWVMFVDSDEMVSKELAGEIASKCQSVNASSGYLLKRKDYFLGKWLEHGETANVKLLRLAKKDAGKWRRPVHEVWDIKGPVGELANPLLHYPHPNVAQFLDEINRYSTLNAQYLKRQGVKASWTSVLAYPKAKFLVNYIWRLGFLDGTAGAIMALMMSFHSFLTRAKLYKLHD
ncbi:glycosyltransferase family 2 protein [Candidatus Gottesmanbacteria bacterium]|nr:glycosyltransferase family 2 protein [Candidatus Gottesmanbacteria bacterium]